MKTFRTCLLVGVLGFGAGFSQDEFDPLGEIAEYELPKIIRVQVEYIEVPHATMTELLSAPRKSANDGELREKLQELVKKGEAKMLETQMATCRSGQRARSESVHEYIYPTEYDPPVLPSPEKDKIPAVAFPMNPATPTAFETRNLGSILEIEPTLGEDSKIIDLRFSPELVYHTGNVIWTEVTKGDDKYKIQMPSFYKISINTSAVLIAGQQFLVGAASPKDEKGDADFSRKVLIFVRADVLTAGR